MKRRLNSLEIDYLQRSKGISRRERFRNDVIGNNGKSIINNTGKNRSKRFEMV